MRHMSYPTAHDHQCCARNEHAPTGALRSSLILLTGAVALSENVEKWYSPSHLREAAASRSSPLSSRPLCPSSCTSVANQHPKASYEQNHTNECKRTCAGRHKSCRSPQRTVPLQSIMTDPGSCIRVCVCVYACVRACISVGNRNTRGNASRDTHKTKCTDTHTQRKNCVEKVPEEFFQASFGLFSSPQLLVRPPL